MNFDENQWYHIYVGDDKDNSFVGTYLVFGDPLLEDTTKQNTTTGAAFKSTNQIEEDQPTQKWQILAFDEEYYVLRTAAGGPNGYLSTNYARDRTNLTSRTIARMVRDNVSDSSVYWKIESWRDGTFQLTNKANGTDWLLEIGGEHDEDDGTEARISSNFTLIPRRQFSFEAIGEVNGTDIGKIDSEDFSRSAISLPATTTQDPVQTATQAPVPDPLITNVSNPSSSPSPTSAPSGGLSAGAKAGIGVGVAAVGLIALVVLGLFLFRRRKRRAATATSTDESNPYLLNGYGDNSSAGTATKYGHYGVAETSELDSNARRAELPHTNPEPVELSGGEVPRQELASGESKIEQRLL
ncbi:hypothetical protein BU23DRAFT_558521 [Bimuria novae-zelandiae CBS 107.79]|uniref:Uncharacterized protein n=1 Tax=Bimuria novae-zelandiae CBS 107.79 TaxID=1447943 RepID=A0A6A5V592_9PLEO|nr:hypothetical protein BU23DRAFT_558521 [Bimuria novae-zelandiae CBS 107.79]